MSPSTKSRLTVGRAVDWQFAATVGAKLVRRGPAATDYTRRQVIDQLDRVLTQCRAARARRDRAQRGR